MNKGTIDGLKYLCDALKEISDDIDEDINQEFMDTLSDYWGNDHYMEVIQAWIDVNNNLHYLEGYLGELIDKIPAWSDDVDSVHKEVMRKCGTKR